MTAICKINECEDSVYVKKLELCKKHAQQHYYQKKKTRRIVNLCRRELHELIGDNVLLFKRTNGSLYRTCKACYASKNRRGALKYHFNISLEEYEQILARQGGHCLFCLTTSSSNGKLLAVDHDHSCCPGRSGCRKCIRGLLCWPCNRRMETIDAWSLDQLQRALNYKNSRYFS